MSFQGLSPNQTPKAIKVIIALTVGVNLFAALFSIPFTRFFHLPPPTLWFTLSSWGLNHFFIWQWITHLFCDPIAIHGFSLGLAINIFFYAYLVWMTGSAICHLKGTKDFLTIFLASALLSALVITPLMVHFEITGAFGGGSATLRALFVAWMILFPEVDLLLFFAFRVKAKWLVVGLIGVQLLVDLSQGQIISLCATTTSALFSYLYAIGKWECYGPFRKFHGFERRWISLIKRLSRRKPTGNATIIDFETGQRVYATQSRQKSPSFYRKWRLRLFRR